MANLTRFLCMQLESSEIVKSSFIVFLLLLLMSCTCFLHGVVDPVLIGEPDHHSDKGNLNLIHVLCIF